MKITLSQYAGFCDGVRRAFDAVNNIDYSKVRKPAYVLGSLVHNQDVVDKIEKKGIKKIDLETFVKSKPGEIGTLIITAHGAGPKIHEIAKEKNIDVIDTTCPKVIKVQRLAKLYSEKGYGIILVGDKEHKEVKSIHEWGEKKAFIISSEADLENLDLKKFNKVVILSQTTQSKDFLEEVHKFIMAKHSNTEILETICQTTDQRQTEVKKLAEENDVILIIGSPDSANSNRLYQTAKKINPKSFFIERQDDLLEEWFVGAKSVAVTAGASTPDWIIEGVMEKLTSLK